MLSSRFTDAPPRIGAVTLRGCGQDLLAARLRMERVLDRVDWTPPGLPSSAILVVRQVRLRTDAPPGVEPAPLARMVSGAVREAAAVARRPWLHADAPRATAVVFLDEAELAACLVRDWLRGVVADRWWWHEVLAGLDVEQWVQRHVLSCGPVSAPAIALLARSGDATSWLAGLDDVDADEASRAVAQAFALPLDAAPRRGGLDDGDARGTLAPKRSRAEPRLVESTNADKWAASFPEVFHAVLAPRQKRLLAIAVAVIRAPSWARSAQFEIALTALDRPRAPSVPSTAARAVPTPTPRRQRRRPPESEAPVGDAERTPWNTLTVRDDLSLGAGHPGRTPTLADAMPHARVASVWDPRAGPVHDKAPGADAGREAADPVEATPMPPESPPLAAEGLPPNAFTLAALPEATRGRGLRTRFGGIFYLLNAALALGLYADFTAPRGPSLDLSPWDWLAWLGQRWFGEEFVSDPVWGALAELAARTPGSAPTAAFVAPKEWSVDDSWLAPWGTAAAVHVHATARRLRVRHPACFDVFDVYRDRDRPPLRQASARCRRYEALKAARLVRTAGEKAGGRSGSARSRWLAALGEYLCARLAVALGADAGTDVRGLVCRTSAHLVASSSMVELHLTLAALPLPIRIAGLDRDPGWIPAAGRAVSFHFS